MALFDEKLTTTDLIRAEVNDLKLGRLVLHPMYIWMKRNRKFVCLKRPVDFLSEKDLNQFAKFDSVFLHPDYKNHDSFRSAAGSILFKLQHPVQPGQLPEPPFQISNSILKTLLSLWDREGKIDLLGVSTLIDDLCSPLDLGALSQTRENNPQLFELAILRSSWTVFAALVLGYCHLDFLSALRHQAFRSLIHNSPLEYADDTLSEVCSESESIISDAQNFELDFKNTNHPPTLANAKLTSRLNRLDGVSCG